MKGISMTLLIAVFTTVIAAQSDPASEPFTIAISTVDSAVKPGAPVRIKINLTNTSGSDLDLSGSVNDRTGQDSNFHYLIHDEKGKAAPKRIYDHPEIGSGSPILGRVVKPGATLTEEQDVSRIHSFTHPGKYVIEAVRPVSSDPKDGLLKSNPITVTVTAPDSPGDPH